MEQSKVNKLVLLTWWLDIVCCPFTGNSNYLQLLCRSFCFCWHIIEFSYSMTVKKRKLKTVRTFYINFFTFSFSSFWKKRKQVAAAVFKNVIKVLTNQNKKALNISILRKRISNVLWPRLSEHIIALLLLLQVPR